MLKPEAKVKVPVRKFLRSIGAYVFSPVQMGIGSSTLDDLCCLGGRFLGIEYKAPGKFPTPRQHQVMAEIQKAGGVWIWGDDSAAIIERIKQNFGLD